MATPKNVHSKKEAWIKLVKRIAEDKDKNDEMRDERKSRAQFEN